MRNCKRSSVRVNNPLEGKSECLKVTTKWGSWSGRRDHKSIGKHQTEKEMNEVEDASRMGEGWQTKKQIIQSSPGKKRRGYSRFHIGGMHFFIRFSVHATRQKYSSMLTYIHHATSSEQSWGCSLIPSCIDKITDKILSGDSHNYQNILLWSRF